MFFLLEKIIDTKIVEFYSMYYTRSGYPSPSNEQKKYNGLWRIDEIRDDGVYATKMTKAAVVRYFEGTNPELKERIRELERTIKGAVEELKRYDSERLKALLRELL